MKRRLFLIVSALLLLTGIISYFHPLVLRYGKEELAWLARLLNGRLSQDRARQPIAPKRVRGLNIGRIE